MVSLIRQVVTAMNEIAPLCLADHSWDNVGLLVESPDTNNSGVVLLTVDLTPEVMEECRRHNAEVIVAYHPPIFTPFRRLTLADPKQRIILQTVRCGASIYSPHTSLDAAAGGINDWLASIVDRDGVCRPIQSCESVNMQDNGGSSGNDNGDAAVGIGRIVTLHQPKAMTGLVKDIKAGLGIPTVRVSLPHGWSSSTPVRSVAVCAGSGSGVFRKLKEHVDVLLSGEMGHHEVLAANAKGQAVILCEHTNTERGYLEKELLPRLQQRLQKDVRIMVSAEDRDPLVVW
ncbi:NGG1 interacting factor 3 [Trypanosoma rangeli]|uniref:NGG1 interacting factor 3 n=1 Tax=Trypanosoma rangeli TaxID=5698 RepID=A0A3R7LAW5_TRYRA|nr:NGG1 interacting factor 3 [Trypanosoma rangeli]RNF10646.1 NGG1 interacting factor 3 [Trypanosoma rangeli]|eukprot:RNF10646.1 NGG1 interacting factor 3 [Trypanosoma rangeli]